MRAARKFHADRKLQKSFNIKLVPRARDDTTSGVLAVFVLVCVRSQLPYPLQSFLEVATFPSLVDRVNTLKSGAQGFNERPSCPGL